MTCQVHLQALDLWHLLFTETYMSVGNMGDEKCHKHIEQKTNKLISRIDQVNKKIKQDNVITSD